MQVLHAEDTHTRHEQMELARQNAAAAAVVASARREAQLRALDSPQRDKAEPRASHATALEEASFTQPQAGAVAAAKAAAAARVDAESAEAAAVTNAAEAARVEMRATEEEQVETGRVEMEAGGADNSGVGQSVTPVRYTIVDNLTMAIQQFNLARSGIPQVRYTSPASQPCSSVSVRCLGPWLLRVC